MAFTCDSCNKTFSRKDNLNRHKKYSCVDNLGDVQPNKRRKLASSGPPTTNAGTSSQSLRILCDSCGRSFSCRSHMLRHKKQSCQNKINGSGVSGIGSNQNNQCNGNLPGPSTSNGVPPMPTTMFCSLCVMNITQNNMVSHRRSTQHRNNSIIRLSSGVQIVNSAFKCRIISYRVFSDQQQHIIDYKTFFNDTKIKVVSLLMEAIRIHRTVKVNMEVFGLYQLPTQDVCSEKSFNTQNQIVDMSTDLDALYHSLVDAMIVQTSEFQEKDSGWALERILHLEVNINKYQPLAGSSYIKLPHFIAKKQAVINIKNQDQHCFAWAITSALFPVENRTDDLRQYPHYSTVLNLAGMDFPVKLQDVKKFEDMNDISVNVFGLESKFKNNKLIYEVVGPLRCAKRRLGRHVNLLLLIKDCTSNDVNHNCDGNCRNSHYCWIKNLSGLVNSQILRDQHKRYFCDDCLIYFTSLQSLQLHQRHDCNHLYTTTPSTEMRIDKFGRHIQSNILKFEHFEKQMKVPFVVYADFESVLKPVEFTEPNPENSYTVKSVKHEPYSFAYIIKCSFDDSVTKFQLYRGDDAAQVFVSSIESDLRELYNTHLKNIKPMNWLTPAEKEEFKNAVNCGICEQPFSMTDVKVRDHCHITGKKRFGAAHQVCNLNYKLPNFIPIVFHNLSGYDCHMFIKELCRHGDTIDVLAQSKEKYISFSKSIYVHDYVEKSGEIKKKYLKLRFLDSFKFLAESLENLGRGLDNNGFKDMQKHFPDIDQFNLMRQKGVFPYSFVNDIDKMNNSSLPTKNEFYDNLNDSHISDEDYDRANRVWQLFKCKNLGEYSDLYLKSDVLSLCDIFENFRDTCLEIYKLDPTQYFTLPSLSFDCMLRMTKVELELLTDIDMINFFKNGIRGGISQCSERKHVANNEYLPQYNPFEPKSFITYLDATNLYGHSMSQSLPHNAFQWLTNKEIADLYISDVDDNSSEGYVLEVDIQYPQDLQNNHSDLPFLVENIVPPTGKTKIPKLIPNLNNKQKYIVHYRTLKQAIQHGLIVTQIHRVLKFNQSPWLKKYIDFNTELRNKATTKFEKDKFKILNNAVFGKTMENVDKRLDIKLVTHWESIRKKFGARALIARPNFKSSAIFTPDLTAIHMGKLKIIYDKPIYAGFSILDISKTVIYDFFYNFIKPAFGKDASLLYTDTDSLILKIYTDNFYQFIANNPDKFDTSNYSESNKYNIKRSVSVLGRMKDEFSGEPIVSFYGTGAKAYYVNSLSKEMKKAKGIKKSVIKSQLNMSDYKRVVECGGIDVIHRKMKTFRSASHDVYTEIQNKVALSRYDDKRYVIPGTTKTLPWGHADIAFYNTDVEQNLQYLIAACQRLINDGDDDL